MLIQMMEMGGMTSCRIDDLSKLIKIEDLRKLLADKFGMPVTRQRLFYQGKQLEDGHTLFDYGVGLNDNVQMMIEADDAEVVKSTSPTKQSHNSPADKNENKVKIQRLSADKSRAEHRLVETQKELAMKGEEGASLAIELARMLYAAKERNSEVQALKADVGNLRRSLLDSRQELREMQSEQRQLARAETVFDGERFKCKALEEELQRPRNVHRWKSLRESESQVQHLERECRLMQMMLTKKSDLLAKMEGELRDEEKAMEELQRKMRCESEVQKTEDYRNEIKPMDVETLG